MSSEVAGAGAGATGGFVGIQVESSQATVSTGLHLSLIKSATFIQAAVGVLITTSVVAATVFAFVVFGISVSPDYPKAPVINTQTYKGTIISIDILAECGSDSRTGTNLTLVENKIGQPRYGSVQVVNGKAIYRAPAHYAGMDSFNYTVMNDKFEKSSYVNVLVMNHPPEAAPLAVTIQKNSKDNKVYIFQEVGSNGLKITDLDNDDLKIVNITSPSFGTASFSDKYIVFTPNYNFNGKDSFNYTISDNNDTSHETIVFTIENSAPQAEPDFFTGEKAIPKNNRAVLDVLANDYDINKDELNITYAGSITKGNIYVDPSKKFLVYTPVRTTASYIDSFEYGITDGVLQSSTYVLVEVKNSPPVASDLAIKVPKNSKPFPINLVYSDPDSLETLSVSISKAPGKGSVSLTNTSTTHEDAFLNDLWIKYPWYDYETKYTPAAGALGADSFEYTVSDQADTTTGRVTVDIVNFPPVPQSQVATCPKRRSSDIDVMVGCTDPNGDLCKLVGVVSPTTNGATVVVLNATHVRYSAPSNGFHDVDTIYYKVKDIQTNPQDELEATGNVTVTIVNEEPVPTGASATAKKGIPIQITVSGSDPNGDQMEIDHLEFDNTDYKNSIVSIVPGAGSGNVKDAISMTPLSAIYTETFYFYLKDEQGLVGKQRGKVTVNVINSPPVAVADSATVHWKSSVTIPVIDNDTDENPGDKQLLEVDTKKLGTQPAHGTLSYSSKTITYTAKGDFTGTDTFTYYVTDLQDSSSLPATVTVTLTNSAPTPQSDSFSKHHRTNGVLLDVLKNDTDPNGDAFTLTSFTNMNTQSGTASVVKSGGISYVQYSSNPNFVGTDTFQYSISDGDLSGTASVTVTVTNTPPTPHDDTLQAHWAANSASVNVLDNDRDEDGDPISLVSNSLTPAAGFKGTVATTSTPGVIKFTPSKDWKGVQSVQYSVTDGPSTVSANLAITVTNFDYPRVLAPISKKVHWKTMSSPLIIPVLTSTTDSDGDTLTLSVDSGNVALSGSNSLSYQHQNFVGTESFTYKISDGLDYAVSAGSVEVYNNAPTCTNYADIVVSKLAIRTIDVLAGAYDADSDSISISNPGSTSLGSLTVTNGKIVFTASSTKGNATITYTVSDGLSTADCTLSISVIDQTDKQYDLHWKTETTGTYFSVLTGVTVPPSPVLDAITTAPQFGYANITGSTVYYKQNAGYLGQDSIVVRLRGSDSSTGPLTIYISVYDNKPVAAAKTITKHWKELVSGQSIDLVAGATDADSADTVTLKSVANGSKGTVVKSSGSATYTSSAGFVGTDSFQFVLTDGRLDASTATVYVTSQNNPPVTTPKSFNVHWRDFETGQSLDVMSGDSTGDAGKGEVLSLISVSDISDATLPSGTIVSNTTTNKVDVKGTNYANKKVAFAYTISDGVETAKRTVDLTVYNSLPNCTDATASVHWRTAQSGVNLYPVSFCKDGDSQDTLSINRVGSPTVTGSTATNSGNTVTYKPKANAIITDSFTTTVTDGSASASQTYTVILTNTAPVATDVAKSVKWNQVLSINGSCSDANSDPLTYSTTSVASLGTFAWTSTSSGYATYTPNTNSYTTIENGIYKANEVISYKCSDSVSDSSIAKLTITVFNTPPSAPTKVYSFDRDFSSTYARTIDLIAQIPADADGDPLTIDSATLQTAYGSQVTISVDKKSLSYTPPKTFAGTDTIKYVVTDGNLKSTGYLNVTMINSPPSCNNFTKTGLPKASTSGPYVLLTETGCTDPNKDAMTFSLPTTQKSGLCTKGSLSLSTNANSQQVVSYTSTAKRSGTDVCEIYVSDGTLTVSVLMTVQIVNNAPNTPSAKTFNYNKWKNSQTYSLNVLTGASDPDTSDSVKVTAFTNGCASAGTLSIVSNDLQFQTTVGFAGTCTFSYTLSDDDVDGPKTKSGSVSITITDSPPVAVDDFYTNTQGSVFTKAIADIMSNDYDLNNDTLTFVGISCQGDSTYCKRTPSIDASGNYITIPLSTTACDTVKFFYTIKTSDGKEATATVSVKDVSCVCTKPVDLMFVVDGSGSISSDNWLNSRNFIKDIISKFTTGPNATWVALTQFSSGVSMTYDSASFCRYVDTDSGYVWACTSESKLGFTFQKTTDNKAIRNMVLALNQMGESTYTIGGLKMAKTYLEANGRANFTKVIVVLTDGAANEPCDCNMCIVDLGSKAACKNPTYWGTADCTTCSWRPSRNKWCMPCAEPRTLAQQINKIPGWKIVSVGVGDGLPAVGWEQVQGLAYKPEAAFKIDWNLLSTIYQTIVDTSCIDS